MAPLNGDDDGDDDDGVLRPRRRGWVIGRPRDYTPSHAGITSNFAAVGVWA